MRNGNTGAAAVFIAMMMLSPEFIHAENRECLASVGLLLNMTIDSNYREKSDSISISTGICANFFFFGEEEVGWYINPVIGMKMKLPPKAERTPHRAPSRMDMYLGAAGGPAFRLYRSERFDLPAGFGADLGITMHLAGENALKLSMGMGLGAVIEGRLNIDGNMGVAAGTAARINLAPGQGRESPLSLWPYLGMGF